MAKAAAQTIRKRTNAPADPQLRQDNRSRRTRLGFRREIYSLTLQTFSRRRVFEDYVVNYFNEQLMEKSDGRLSLDIYSGGSLCAPGDVLDACLTGIADIAFTYTATSPGRFPVSSIIDHPYDYASAQSCGAAINDIYNQYTQELASELEGA